MDTWKQLISIQEISNLIEKDANITQEDRIRIQSWTYHPLVNELSDLKPTEYSEVYHLEEQNIYKVMTIASSWTNHGMSEKLEAILNIMIRLPYPLRQLLDKTHEDNPLLLFKDNFRILALFMLSEGDINRKLKPVFEGKIPSKLFSFRQTTAEMWFTKYCQLSLEIGEFIMKKLGAEEADIYFMANTAYYLNKSQPFKYHTKESDKNMNETIGRVLIEYLQSLGKTDLETMTASVPLYKDL